MFRRTLVTSSSRCRLLSYPPSTGRSLATNQQVHRIPKQEPDEDADFRPPWVYTWSRLLSYTIIPTIAIYSIFFYDFGDREHVFQPARRWAANQKAAFFTLSPAESKMIQAEVEKSVSAPDPEQQPLAAEQIPKISK